MFIKVLSKRFMKMQTLDRLYPFRFFNAVNRIVKNRYGNKICNKIF